MRSRAAKADDVFHIELRQSPHVAHAFNLSRANLERQIVGPWNRADPVELDERIWDSKRAKLTIYAGRALHMGELGLGRGWPSVTKFGRDVTQQVLSESRGGPPAGEPASSPAAAGIEVTAADFGREVVAACAGGAVGVEELPALLAERLAHRRVSERLAVVEQTVWELLHRGRVRLIRVGEEVPRGEWQSILLTWETWTGTAFPPITVEATAGPGA